MPVNLTIIIIAIGISTIFFSVIFPLLWNYIEFKLWWRKWKRFIDKQYDDAKKPEIRKIVWWIRKIKRK